MGVTNSSFLSPNASHGNVKGPITQQENPENPINGDGNFVQEIVRNQSQELPIDQLQKITIKQSREIAMKQPSEITGNQSPGIARNQSQEGKLFCVPDDNESQFTRFEFNIDDSVENETEGPKSEKSDLKVLNSKFEKKAIRLYCDLCYRAKTIEYAECFCVTCELFCCTLCASKHALLNNTFLHKYLFEENMPVTKRLPDETFICQTHEERFLRYFCKNHELVCCSACIIQLHSECNRLCSIKNRHQNGIDEQLTRKGTLKKTNEHHDKANEVNFVKELTTKHGNDAHSCWITDCKVLRNGHLTLIDHNNDCLKIIDILDNRFMAYVIIGRPNKPWALSEDYNDNIVVTCGYEILIYDSITLQITEMITIDDWVRGIACDTDLLIYACTSPRPTVRVITRGGLIVNSFELNADGQNLFVCPWYLTVSRSRNHVYVSDCGNNYITCVKRRDDIQNKYRHRSLERPQGLTFGPRDKLFICGQGHVIEVAGNFKREHVVLEADGYQSLCFDETNSLLCVSYDRVSRKSNLISILSVKDR